VISDRHICNFLILVFLEQKAGKDGRSGTKQPQKEAARAWSKNKLEANILRRRGSGWRHGWKPVCKPRERAKRQLSGSPTISVWNGVRALPFLSLLDWAMSS